jgi:two-component system, OmpR family, sensor kinase
MNIRKSIRWRIQAWHGALLLAMCAGFGITAYQLEYANALSHADQELELRLNSLTNALSQGGGSESGGRRPPPEEADKPERPPREGPRRPPGFRSSEVTSLFDAKEPEPFYYQAWTRKGSPLDQSSAAPSNIPRPILPTAMQKAIRSRDGFRELSIFTPPGECLLVGRSMAELDRTMRELAWKLIMIGAAVLAFGLAVGWWIATRALLPISHISAAASRIAAGNLKERIRTNETESELGRLASLLDETFLRLDAAFEEQARFTSDAAHELRTPVSIILAQSQLALAKDRSAEEYRDTIKMSQRAATRMHELIESLLQLAVLDSSQRRQDLELCDLADTTAEQLTMMRSLAEGKSTQITSDFTAAPCMANLGHIAQIVANLITNAVKFSPEGSKIHVSTATQNGMATLSVSDNGHGIPEIHLPHLFERFYRADTSRNRATGGAGLGLAICKRIAEAHGGSLTVTSTVGRGSIFTLQIPAYME